MHEYACSQLYMQRGWMCVNVCVCVAWLGYRCQLLLFIFSHQGFVARLLVRRVARPAAGMLFSVSCCWQGGCVEEACHNLELELFCMCTAGGLHLFVDCDSSWHQTVIRLVVGHIGNCQLWQNSTFTPLNYVYCVCVCVLLNHNYQDRTVAVFWLLMYSQISPLFPRFFSLLIILNGVVSPYCMLPAVLKYVFTILVPRARG